MPQTQDPDEFKEAWNNHIGVLSGLSQTLPEDKWAELNAALDDLHDLVDVAADELESDA